MEIAATAAAVVASAAVPNGKERQILDLIPRENSWEQILYEVVAVQNIDPWNVDLNLLAHGFTDYISNLKDFDFRIPAKWVIIAAILLRMKSDYIKIIKTDAEPDLSGGLESDLAEFEAIPEPGAMGPERLDVDPIENPSRRRPVRKITLTELVDSLRKVFRAEKRREVMLEKRRSKVNVSGEDITKRIENLYTRISGMLGRIKNEEIKFSNLVETWEKDKVVDTFLPLIHLDQDKRVCCRQEKIFEEIFIKKREAVPSLKAAPAKAVGVHGANITGQPKAAA